MAKGFLFLKLPHGRQQHFSSCFGPPYSLVSTFFQSFESEIIVKRFVFLKLPHGRQQHFSSCFGAPYSLVSTFFYNFSNDKYLSGPKTTELVIESI